MKPKIEPAIAPPIAAFMKSSLSRTPAETHAPAEKVAPTAPRGGREGGGGCVCIRVREREKDKQYRWSEFTYLESSDPFYLFTMALVAN